MDWSVFVGPIASGLIAFVGSWFAFSNRLTATEVRIDELRKQVEKHNQVVERTIALERDVKTAVHEINDLKTKR